MKGFKDFLLRGNLIELAVAFVMGLVFARVVEAFTKIMLDILGLIFSVEGLSDVAVQGINIGNFLTAVITFLFTAAVIYFAVVVPTTGSARSARRTSRRRPASAEDLLAEIRDLLRDRSTQV